MHYLFIILIFVAIDLNCRIAAADRHHPCSDKFHKLVVLDRNLSLCQKLPTLGAELGWSHPTGTPNEVIEFVFGAPIDEKIKWLAWGVNPGPNAEMVGTKAAIGIINQEGNLTCDSYDLTWETKIGCHLRPSTVKEIKCSGERNERMEYYLITANVNVSNFKNLTKLNIVWQIGLEGEGNEPKMHEATLRNVDSVETLDLYTGKSSDMTHFKINLRKVHGIFNIVGWGTMLPIGVIVARYFREFPFHCDEAWFHFHAVCQTGGYLMGVVGWVIGMWLGQNSHRYTFFAHRFFGISIFVCATLQTLALQFRPTPQDSFRQMWNIYHHFLGYTLLILVYINIFQGIKLLKPEINDNWKFAVIGILLALVSITLALECYTWKKFYDDKRKKNKHEADFGSPHTTKTDGEDSRGVPIGSVKNGRSKDPGSLKIGGGDPRGVTTGSVKNDGGDLPDVTHGSIKISDRDPHRVGIGSVKGRRDVRDVFTESGSVKIGGENPREASVGSVKLTGGRRDSHGA